MNMRKGTRTFWTFGIRLCWKETLASWRAQVRGEMQVSICIFLQWRCRVRPCSCSCRLVKAVASGLTTKHWPQRQRTQGEAAGREYFYNQHGINCNTIAKRFSACGSLSPCSPNNKHWATPVSLILGHKSVQWFHHVHPCSTSTHIPSLKHFVLGRHHPARRWL